MSKMLFPTASSLLLMLLFASTVLASMPKDEQQDEHNHGMEKQPAMERHRRSMYFAMMQGIGINKEATRWGCRVVRTSFCNKFEKTLGIERRTRRGTTASGGTTGEAHTATADNAMVMMEGIMPTDVGTALDRTTAELRKTAATEGFYEMSQTAQERVLLETAGKQGDIMKEKLKEAIDGARKMIERALGTIISYSEMPMESKIAMEQVFMTLTDETKTPTQKVERIKEIEQKWTPEMREMLKPSMDDKELKEAAHFFTSVPQQIELGKN